MGDRTDGEPTVFQAIQERLHILMKTAINIHLEYFIAGVFLGTHSPVSGWLFLTFLLSLPTITLLQNPEWIQRLRYQQLEHLVLFGAFMASSQGYAFYTLSRAIGFKV